MSLGYDINVNCSTYGMLMHSQYLQQAWLIYTSQIDMSISGGLGL